MIAELYAKPYDHLQWDEHVERVRWTIARLNTFLSLRSEIAFAVDLSCGDGAVLRGLSEPIDRMYGDLVDAPHLTIEHGPIEERVRQVTGDLLICSETLEHLNDPYMFLHDASKSFKWVAITTPLGEDDPEKNYEHYWGWDTLGIATILDTTGWQGVWLDTLNLPYYTYQMWIARSTWH